MNRKKMLALLMCAGLTAGMSLTVYAEESTEAASEAITEDAAETAAQTEADGEDLQDQLSAPTDFVMDPNTGEYSFTATDDRTGYYFVRFYALDEKGNEEGEYITSSKRIKGGTTGTITGTLDLSEAAWGSYHVNLTAFPPAGTDIKNPDPVKLTVQYGVGQTLERPEMLVMTSGNQAELVVDWWTLCDYAFTQYMPSMEFTFYSDAECTQEVLTDVVDLEPLMDTLRKNPPGVIYIWGWSTSEGPHFYTAVNPEADGDSAFGASEKTFAFKNDIYTYELEAGTYYVTAQALTKDEFTLDSKVSTPVEITLTDEEPAEEFEYVTTELWQDPQLMDMPGANPGQQPDRIDTSAEQGISGKLID